jgi:hypothetical protein
MDRNILKVKSFSLRESYIEASKVCTFLIVYVTLNCACHQYCLYLDAEWKLTFVIPLKFLDWRNKTLTIAFFNVRFQILRYNDRFTRCTKLTATKGSFEIHGRNSMEENLPSEADSSAASQEFLCVLWRRPIPYSQESLVSVVYKTNSIHTLPSYFFRIHFNIIDLRFDRPMFRSFRVSHQILYVFFSRPCLPHPVTIVL